MTNRYRTLLPAFVRDVQDFQRETGHAAPKQRSMMISKRLMGGRIARWERTG
jgi:hypothetical protein